MVVFILRCIRVKSSRRKHDFRMVQVASQIMYLNRVQISIIVYISRVFSASTLITTDNYELFYSKIDSVFKSEHLSVSRGFNGCTQRYVHTIMEYNKKKNTYFK